MHAHNVIDGEGYHQISIPPQADVPHADIVLDVAEAVRAIVTLSLAGSGASLIAIGQRIGKSDRHAGYYANAARIWGCAVHPTKGGPWFPTNAARALEGTSRGSAAERDAILSGMKHTPFVERVVFGAPIGDDQLLRLVMEAPFSASSAKRRLMCLRMWRRYAIGANS